jgi:hypothetical protein
MKASKEEEAKYSFSHKSYFVPSSSASNRNAGTVFFGFVSSIVLITILEILASSPISLALTSRSLYIKNVNDA